MNGWIVLSIVLGVATLAAIAQAVVLDQTLTEVTEERDRAAEDRAASARVFASRKLLDAAFVLRKEAAERFEALGPNDKRAAAFWDAAGWISETYVPEVAAMQPDDPQLQAAVDLVRQAHADGAR